MTDRVDSVRPLTPMIAVLMTLVALTAVYLRTEPIGLEGLWMDEVFSASFANLSWADLVVAVTRYDVHPPFYYLQLSVWRWISAADSWLLLNSVLWSVITLGLVFQGTRREFGNATAVLAMMLVAVCGSEVMYATELRMYAMITAVTLVGWHLADRWIRDDRRTNTLMLIMLILLLAGLHGAAFVPASALILYALVQSYICHQAVRWRPVLSLVGGCAVVFIPFLLNSSVRSLSHLSAPAWADVVQTLSGWLLGYGALPLGFPIRLAACAVVLGGMLTVMLKGPLRAKLLMGCFVVWPVVIVAGVSHLVRPIWIDRTLTFAVPFWMVASVMCLASLQQTSARRLGHVLAFLLCACMLVVSWQQTQLPRKMQYKEAAEFVGQHNTNAAAIYVPVNVAFWATARYLHRAEWGSLLKIQDPSKPDRSEVWPKVYDKLGPLWLKRLGLVPERRVLHTAHGNLWIGLSPVPASVSRQGMWIVGTSQQEAAEACGEGLAVYGKRFRGVSVWRCGQLAELGLGSR